jgi:hypothetical protein
MLLELAQPRRAQARVAQPAETDGDVDAFGDQVDHAVAAAQLDLQRRMRGPELDQRARQAVARMVGGAGDAQAAGEPGRARPAQRSQRRFDTPQRLQPLLQQRSAGLGERGAARGAGEEAGAELGLEPRHVEADTRLGDAQAIGRGGEAAGLGHRGDAAQRVQVDRRAGGHAGYCLRIDDSEFVFAPLIESIAAATMTPIDPLPQQGTP